MNRCNLKLKKKKTRFNFIFFVQIYILLHKVIKLWYIWNEVAQKIGTDWQNIAYDR
jgi:hypothetical protein